MHALVVWYLLISKLLPTPNNAKLIEFHNQMSCFDFPDYQKNFSLLLFYCCSLAFWKSHLCKILVLLVCGKELGLDLRASLLQSRRSTAQATPLVHFALAILEMKSLKVLAFSSLEAFLAPQVARISCVNHRHSASCIFLRTFLIIY
jgi:hypothetical protein